MPRGKGTGRSKGSTESALQMKAVVICMRLFYKETFEEIERKIGMKATTARGIWQRAHDLAQSNDLIDLLSVLDLNQGAGRPEKFTDGTLESAAIRTLLYDERHKTFEQVAEDHDIPLARRKIERIAHDHRDRAHPRPIVRRAQQIKPFLNLDTMEWRLEYSEWALAKLDEGAISVFSDEDYHNFGGAPHKKHRITRMEGEPSTPKFSFMHWGACCIDTDIPMPMHIWDVKTAVEKEKHKVALEVENTSTRAEVEQQRTRAKHPGAEENRELAEINANIERFNIQR